MHRDQLSKLAGWQVGWPWAVGGLASFDVGFRLGYKEQEKPDKVRYGLLSCIMVKNTPRYLHFILFKPLIP